MTYIFQKHYSINPEISRQDDIDRYLIEISEAYERSKDFEIKAFVLALESWEYFWKHLTLCMRYRNRISEIYEILQLIINVIDLIIQMMNLIMKKCM